MPLRKRANKDGAGGTTQPTAGEREEDVSDDSEVEFLSLSPATSQSKRKRKAKSKAAPKELTEEEMFDLAVRLSEQEASDAARRRQQEEDEALQRAIEESMSQTQPLPPSRSPSPPLDSVPRRRRLEFCSDDPGPSVRLDVSSQRSCRADSHPELLDRKGPGGDTNNNRTKRKRNDEDSSPLPEMPDLSQTQKIFTQRSPFPSSSFSQPSEPLSTQDFEDCTQHESSQLPPPPPVALRESSVYIPKMSQELLATCQSASQDNFMSSLPSRSMPPTCTKGLSLTVDSALPQSPTFPKSPVFSGGQREQDSSSSTSPIFGRTSQNLRPTPKLSDSPALSKNVVPAKTSPSPTFLGSQGISKNPCLSESHSFDKSDIFSVADDVDDVDTQPQSQDYSTTSPVFGKLSQKNKKPSLVCKPNRSLSNAASPTFPRSTDNLTESSRPLPKSLLLSESDPEDDVLIEQGHTATSPVFGRPSQNQRPSLACKPNLSGSPTFPKDPAVSKTYPNIPNTPTYSRSPRTPIFSETNSEEDEVKAQGINTTSPVFGRTSQGPGHRPSLACKPNITLNRSPTAPRSQTDSESVISSKSLTFPKSPLFSDTEREEDSDWTSWKSKVSLSPVFPAERGLLRPSIHTFSPNYKLGPRHRGTRRDVEGGGVFPGPSEPCSSTRRLHQLPGRGDNHHHHQGQNNNNNEPRPGPSQGLARRLPAHTLEAGGGVMVCYCWGIPFCPRGRDPDTYTEVIVEQLEFYEKSLKRAQRGLLRKMEWSDPILPQPEKAPSPESSAESTIRHPTRRRGLRLRPKRRAKSTSASSPEKDDENEEEEKNDDEQDNNKDDFKLTMVTTDEEDDHGDDKSKDGRDDNKEEQEDNKNNVQAYKQEKDEQEQRTTAADEDDTDCEEVCPETQLEPDDETQVLIMPTSHKAEPQSPSQPRSESQTVLPVRPQSTDQRRTPGERSESQTVLPVRPQSTDQRRTPEEMSESQTVLPVQLQSTDHRRTPEEMDVDAPADEEKEQEDMIVASPDDGGQDERMEEEREEFNTTFLERPSESWTGGSPIKESRTGEEEEMMTTTAALQGSSDPPGSCSPRGQASSTMACPLCQASFPLDQIEMHAATCYGVEEEQEEAGGGGGGGGHFYSTAADHFPASPRPKRARNRGLTAEETAAHSSSVRNRGLTEEASQSSAARLFDKKEKCYICHKAVPLSEFGRHTEKCIRQQSRSEQRGGGGGGGGGDLLSALEQTDSREPTEAGPSGVNYKEVIDLSGHEEEEEEEEGGEEEEEESEDVLCVSDSPIRAFTSVSEASDCLVDFKKQLNPRSPPRREAGKRGRGRGRGRGGGRGGGRGASRGRAVKRKYTR